MGVKNDFSLWSQVYRVRYNSKLHPEFGEPLNTSLTQCMLSYSAFCFLKLYKNLLYILLNY